MLVLELLQVMRIDPTNDGNEGVMIMLCCIALFSRGVRVVYRIG